MSAPAQTRDRVHLSKVGETIVLSFGSECTREEVNCYGEMLDGITGLGASVRQGHVLTCRISTRNTTERERKHTSDRVRTRLERNGVRIVDSLSDLEGEPPVH